MPGTAKRVSGFTLPSRVVLAFGLGSLALLVTTVGAFWHEYRAEWRVWQRLDAALSGNDGGAGLRQIWLADMNRVDRCTSCHLRLDTPVAGAPAAPLRAHPEGWLEAHRVDQFGCSACHGGVGEATSRRGVGHPGAGASVDPLVSRELMEARCGTCHLEREPRGADLLARGRARIAESSCTACHEIPGFDTREVRVPRLDGLSQKAGPSWLRRWLRKPSDLLPRTRMGNFRLTIEEIDALSALLLQPGAPALAPAAARGDPARGGRSSGVHAASRATPWRVVAARWGPT